MKHVIDGYEFTLRDNSTSIYIFKGDALTSIHVYPSFKKAKEAFKQIKTKKRVIWK